MGFCEILTIIFVIAKLTGVVRWSWFQCLMPEIVAVFIYGIIFITTVIWLHIKKKEFKDMLDWRNIE